MDRDFDEDIDEYSPNFELFQLVSRPSNVDMQSLVTLIHDPKIHLGQVPVNVLAFDQTRRKKNILSGLLPFLPIEQHKQD